MYTKNQILRLITLLIILLGLNLSSCSLPTPTPPPCSVDFLISSINNANDSSATTTIELAAGCTYILETIDNITNGNNGLPSITSPIIINGNDAIIRRNLRDPRVPFRLFHISGQGELFLNRITLLDGYALNPSDPSEFFSNIGGAIYNAGRLSVDESLIQSNSAMEGGGIFNMGTMWIEETTIQENKDYRGYPGGTGIYNRGHAIITNSTISKNGFPEAEDWPITDGIFNEGNMEISNSTISGNADTGIDNEGQLELDYVTIAFNGIQGLFSISGYVTLENTLFGPNGGITRPLRSCGGIAIHPIGVNMDTDGTCSVLTVTPEQLKLAPLGAYGGPTDTHALLPGSPAIDAATHDCPSIDQRNEPRPFGLACDLGAYEYDGSSKSLAQMQGGTVTITATSMTAQPSRYTLTVPPTATFTLEPSMVTAITTANCRSGPDTQFDILGSLHEGQTALVDGRNTEGTWFWVRQVRGVEHCWISEITVESNFNPADIIIVAAPPTKTATTTRTSTATSKPASEQGCTVRQLTGAIKCVVPCPQGAVPGEPCIP